MPDREGRLFFVIFADSLDNTKGHSINCGLFDIKQYKFPHSGYRRLPPTGSCLLFTGYGRVIPMGSYRDFYTAAG